jgi:ParB family chromosome partitioning protein
MAAFDSIDDVKIGTIFSDSFNGMSDFYEVIDKTNKSITLRKIKWETCAPDSDADFDPTASEDVKESALVELPLSKIQRDENQPRKEFSEESLKTLSESIKQHGVLQPIVVVKTGEKYTIVAGERRYRASKLANLETIPAIIRTLDAQTRMETSIIENAQREDLNAIEMATAYAKLKAQFNMTPAQIAERVSKSESSVINTMRLLNLPESAKKTMVEHNLSESVMRPLVAQDEAFIAKVLPKIVKEGWTSQRVERYVQDTKKKSSASLAKLTRYHKDEDALAAKYGAKVKISGHSITFKVRSDVAVKELIKNLL